MMYRVVPALALAFFVTACDKEKDKGTATFAKLAVANSTAAALTEDGATFTPTVLGLQLIDVRIMQELDSTQHPAPIIWYNPECGSATTTNTEVDGKTYEYTQSPGCDLSKITTYFDFARPTADVNAELNSQPNKVYPETYKFVSITWCAGETPTDNVKFQADGMTEPAFVGSGGCGQISSEAVPPLVIAEGETITISLDYSIEGIVGPTGNGCWTSTDGATVRCINVPQFSPSATKG